MLRVFVCLISSPYSSVPLCPVVKNNYFSIMYRLFLVNVYLGIRFLYEIIGIIFIGEKVLGVLYFGCPLSELSEGISF